PTSAPRAAVTIVAIGVSSQPAARTSSRAALAITGPDQFLAPPSPVTRVASTRPGSAATAKVGTWNDAPGNPTTAARAPITTVQTARITIAIGIEAPLRRAWLATIQAPNHEMNELTCHHTG